MSKMFKQLRSRNVLQISALRAILAGCEVAETLTLSICLISVGEIHEKRRGGRPKKS